MRKVLIGLGVLAIFAPAMATPINYAENWDSYAAGTGDANYQANWPAISGQAAFPISAVTSPKSSPHSLLQQASVNFGIKNNLADGVEMAIGEQLIATAGSPLTVGIWWNPANGTNRQANSFILELASGDTPLVGVANCEVVPTDGNNNPYFFNGSGWSRQGGAGVFTSQGWSDVSLTLTPGGGGYNVALKLNATTINLSIPYSGGFDTIRIRALGTTTLTSWIDNLYLTGGDIVPEPAALATLALGVPLMFMRRRSCRPLSSE